MYSVLAYLTVIDETYIYIYECIYDEQIFKYDQCIFPIYVFQFYDLHLGKLCEIC